MPVMGKENLEKASSWGWADTGLRSGCLLENPQAGSVEIFTPLLGGQTHKRKGDLRQELWWSCPLPSPCSQASLPFAFPSLSPQPTHIWYQWLKTIHTITHSFIKHSLSAHQMPNSWVTQMNLIPILSSRSSQSRSPLLIITTCEKGPEQVANTEKINKFWDWGGLESSWLFCG